MKWTDLRYLEKGDTVTYGDSQFTSKCSYTREARIKHITIKGGILVRNFEIDDGNEPTGREQWVPYNHIISFPKRRRNAA